MSELPHPTDTLDFENVNAPFIVADKNQFFIDKKTEKLVNFVKELRIFTEKDEITIVSNGVKNFFEVDLRDMRVLLDGPVRIVADGYVKDDTPFDELTSATPLNVKEASVDLINKGFMAKNYAYTFLLSKDDLLLSNMLSISEVREICIQRDVIDVSLSLPYARNINTSNNFIFSRGEAEDTLIHKTKETPAVSIVNDDVVNASFDSVTMFAAEMEPGYVAVEPEDSLTKEFMDASAYSLSGMMRAPVFIDNVVRPEAPVTKEKASELAGKYISKTDKEAESIEIRRVSPEIEDNFILSSDEAENQIDDFFSKVTDPSIDNIDEFENYLVSLCDNNDDFLDYNFEVKGGKVYLGFDYDNMNSLFNSEAISRILFESLGDFSNEMGRTFDASRYFKDQTEINALAAYAQTLGLGFDISKDTVGQVFSSIRAIVAKLCILSPDIIPNVEEKLEIPVFEPAAIIVPPQFDSFFVPYIKVFMATPTFFKIPVFFTVFPPSFPTGSYNVQSVFLSEPRYFDTPVSTQIYPPSLPTFFNPGLPTPPISKPTLDIPTSLRYSTRRDGRVETMIFFESLNSCKERYRAVSYRTLNMIDMSAIFAGLIASADGIGKYFWLKKSEGRVLYAPQMVGLFLGDVYCRIAEETGIAVNIDIPSLFSAREPATAANPNPGDTASTCSSGALSALATTVGSDSRLMENLLLSLNGNTIDGAGTVEGTPKIEDTEWFTPTDTSIPAWMEYNSTEYMAMVDSVVASISAEISLYMSTTNITKWDEITSSIFTVSGFNYITKGTLGQGKGHAMAEYLDLENCRIAELKFSSLADPMGIESSAIEIDSVTSSNLMYAYNNVVIGNYNPPSGDWKEYRADPPPPKPGAKKVYVWKPLVDAPSSSIFGIKHLSLDPANEAVFSVYGPVVLVGEVSPGVFEYQAIGVDTISRGVVNIGGTSYHTLEAEDNTILLGDTRFSGPATAVEYGQAPCDPWLSPNDIYAFPGMSGSAGDSISPMLGGGNLDAADMQIVNKAVDCATCSGVPSGTSGIDPAIKSNISDITTIESEAGSQAEGDTPGALGMTLNMKLSKYVPKINQFTGVVDDVVETGEVKICMTLGVVDGLKDAGGDILAQGLSQDEIDSTAATATNEIYVGPSSEFRAYTDMVRQTIGGEEASVFTVRLADIIADTAIDQQTNDNFTKYWDPFNESWEVADVKLAGDSTSLETDAPFGTVLTGEFKTPGMIYSYKHAGQNPDHPVVTGYSGSSEVDFINGTKLTATVPGPLPQTVVTNDVDASAQIAALNLADGNVYFFVNLATLQVVIKDTDSFLSENRKVKVMWT